MTFADYLFRANVCLAGLFGLYWLLFRRHTFFALNRAYLLLTLLAAALLPLIELPTETANLPMVYLPMVTTTVAQTPDFSLTDALWWGYGLGVTVCAIWLLLGFWRVARLIVSGERVAQPGYTLVVVENSRLSPFSFFKYLVISRSDYNQHHQTVPYDPSDGPIDNPIFRHELVHIRQWHSADMLLAEVAKCLCWCNPVAWWLPRALQQTHEFLADQSATDARLTRADYARFLVSYALGAKPQEAQTLLITNSFAEFSQLKHRIIMLKTNPTNRRAMWLYALALPVVALLTMCTQNTAEEVTNTRATQTNQARISGEVVKLAEESPEFPGGKEKLMDYLGQHLVYPAAAQQAGTEGIVFIQYVVTKDGDVTDARVLKGIGKGCDEEALRVVQEMPRWKPARNGGKAVNLQYNLPIWFTMEE